MSFHRSECILAAVGLSLFASVAAHSQLPPLFAQGGLLGATDSPIIVQATTGGSSTSPDAGPVRETVVQSQPGPWGKLEYFHVYLEAPPYLVEKFPLPNTQTRWIFNTSTSETLEDVLGRCGMTAEEITALTTAPGKLEQNGKVYFFPPRPLVEALTSETRARVYKLLSRLPENEFYAEPVLFASGNIEQWFAGTKLKPSLLDLVKKLSYLRGDIVAFSDLAILISEAGSESEAREILKAMTRTRSLIVKLLLDSTTDFPTMLKYWTTGLNTRRKDAQPMLESVVAVQGAEKLDLMHMLPALPRKLLLTYPDFSLGLDGLFPDCHWTSLNFFNYKEQAYLLDARLATTAVLERFGMIDAPYKFGDIIFFLDNERGDAFHSCVYIADDIVFTKNGRNLLSPWILMKLDEVKKIYLHDGNGHIQGFRNKNAIAEVDGVLSDMPQPK
jgi:hypothetical protein